jgi:hypothetical protein
MEDINKAAYFARQNGRVLTEQQLRNGTYFFCVKIHRKDGPTVQQFIIRNEPSADKAKVYLAWVLANEHPGVTCEILNHTDQENYLNDFRRFRDYEIEAKEFRPIIDHKI